MGTFRKLAAACAAAALATAGLAAPARAAVPDGHGFVLWNGAATVPGGTWPPATIVTPGGSGLYRIIFPGQAARGGVVHVTAVNGGPAWCQALRWGPTGADEVVYVRCYKPGGTPADTPFSAVFASSTPPDGLPGQYGYVHADLAGTVISQYNSASALNSVVPLGPPGQYRVRLPGLATPGPVDGSVQVTAAHPNVGAHCEVARLASSPAGQDVIVLCFDGTGTPLNTWFTLSYQYERSLFGSAVPPKYFGYLWNMPPPPAPNVGPPPTNFNSQLGPGANAAAPAGLGLTLVGFRALAQRPDNVQATPFGRAGEFCNLQAAWGYSGTTVLVRNVACYTPAGARADSGSFTSYNSEF
ncbi:hypothetical protein [Phytohabitans houttuyneae]|uniref:Uncharacterized protein n=1 Tax=Phytohabitans houttuyneae TaxID=1076126 RepID=A0A6V8K088_9ACTN|nr:hypothetical protein [Phytohabitans houttuyneae]GFJ76960.1 hypothetical protein Phou_011400 [Phytohabitans houttuyneae]